MKNEKAYYMNNNVIEVSSCSLEEYQPCLLKRDLEKKGGPRVTTVLKFMLSTGCDHSLHTIHTKYPYEKQPFPGTSSGKEAAVKGKIPKLLNPPIMNLLCVKYIR